MDWQIAGFLAVDGFTSGAIYALLALALVLVFSVTRIILVPLGELMVYAGVTLALLGHDRVPATGALLLAMGVACFALELWEARRGTTPRRLALAAVKFLALPLALLLITRWAAPRALPLPLDMALTTLLIVPMGPMLYRIVFQPMAEASTLVLLIVSVATHFALTGLGLVMFGPEGWSAAPLWDASFDLAGVPLSGQSLAIWASSLLLMLALYLFFSRTLPGKALRAVAVNRLGARLIGVGSAQAGRLTFTLATAIVTACGMLAAPLTALTYDGGFVIALKGFIGAIIGGLVGYPLAAAGALLVGLLEAFASFWASSYKEVIVFTLVLPVLLWRSLASHGRHHDDEEEE